MCASVQAVALRIRPFLFYFQPGPRGTRGATSPTTLQCTQLKVDQPKSLLWWAKLLKTKLRCENKQRVASLRQSGSRAIFGWPPVWRSASWKRKTKLRQPLFGAAIKTTRPRRTSSERPPFWVVTETDSGAHAYMSVYESLCLQSPISAARARPRCTRSRPDRVWSPALHTGPGRGTPFLKLIYLSSTQVGRASRFLTLSTGNDRPINNGISVLLIVSSIGDNNSPKSPCSCQRRPFPVKPFVNLA